jgi:hypothetical protein
VIVEGMQKVRPGGQVNPTTATDNTWPRHRGAEFMSNFFIRRPIVAIVISILTLLIGVVVIRGLSIEQYPFLAPPNIRVTATYPGASAEAVEQSVATPIEQEVNGVRPHDLYEVVKHQRWTHAA